MFRQQSENLLKDMHIDGFARVFGRTKQTPVLGTQELLLGYDRFPWIRAISDKIGQGVGSTIWELFARDLEIENHPLLDLLARPNPTMSGKAFFKWSGTQFTLVREIFWLIERNGVGMPIELWPIPANWVNDIPVMGNPDGFFELAVGGHRTFVPASEIIYIRDFSPNNPYGRSSSPAKALGDEIESDEFAAKYVKDFFLNGARPDLLIFSEDPKNPIDPASAKRLENTWLSKLQGLRKRFKPFFMPGKIGIKELQSDLKSMDLVDQRKWWRDITLQVYGIPPESLGIIENSNRATIAAAEFFLTKHVLVPNIEMIIDGMNLSLVPQFDTRLTLGFVSPVQEDKEHKLEVTKEHAHAFRLDEIRKDAGLEALPDGKGQVFPFQFNTLFSDTPGGGNSGGTAQNEPKALEKFHPSGLAETLTKVITDNEIEEILLQVDSADPFNPSVNLANTETVAAFGQEIVDQVSVGVSFDITAPKVTEFLATQSSSRITGKINPTTRKAIRTALAEGQAAGEGAALISKRITEVFDQASRVRAIKIARTESVRAANFGSLEAMKQVRIKQKQWLTVGDSEVRSSHQSINGQIVDTNNAFTSINGNQAQHPGGFGIAEEDIECRCSILAVIVPESANINIPSTKDFERERLPFERLMERAYVKGFEAQEKLVQEALKLTEEL